MISKNKLSEVDFPPDAIIGGVVRGNITFIAHGDSELKPNDRVVVFALPSAIGSLGKFFS
jgi:trk system potassium uptake protein TrkA